MSTTHHPNDQRTTTDRPARCLRHHVWMAACPDCLDARLGRLSGARNQPAAG